MGDSGLGSSVEASGPTYRPGAITKQGRRDLRAALVEAAWIAVRDHPHGKPRFERLAARIGKRKAIVAIARKRLVVMWHVLTHQVADAYAQVEAVARKLMKWGERHHRAKRLGLSRIQFTQQQLAHLNVGGDLQMLIYKGYSSMLPQTESG